MYFLQCSFSHTTLWDPVLNFRCHVAVLASCKHVQIFCPQLLFLSRRTILQSSCTHPCLLPLVMVYSPRWSFLLPCFLLTVTTSLKIFSTFIYPKHPILENYVLRWPSSVFSMSNDYNVSDRIFTKNNPSRFQTSRDKEYVFFMLSKLHYIYYSEVYPIGVRQLVHYRTRQ